MVRRIVHERSSCQDVSLVSLSLLCGLLEHRQWKRKFFTFFLLCFWARSFEFEVYLLQKINAKRFDEGKANGDLLCKGCISECEKLRLERYKYATRVKRVPFVRFVIEWSSFGEKFDSKGTIGNRAWKELFLARKNDKIRIREGMHNRLNKHFTTRQSSHEFIRSS